MSMFLFGFHAILPVNRYGRPFHGTDTTSDNVFPVLLVLFLYVGLEQILTN